MKNDKAEYEKLIDSSILFSLNREKEPNAYKKEAFKMVEYLYCYLMAINSLKYEPYGVEIVETANHCITNYKPEAGRFLNYFTASWKQMYGHLAGKELVKETFKGIHFTEEEERNFRKYMKLAQNMGINTESIEFDEKVAEAMGISAKEISNLRNMINCKPTLGNNVSGEGEEYSLFDQIDSGKYSDEGILQFEAAKEFLDLLEITFNQLQERQKPMIALLITTKIALLVSDDEKLVEFLKQKSFYDENIYIESVKRGEQIQAKEIAKRFGVVEASISRTWKSFKDKVILYKNNKHMI